MVPHKLQSCCNRNIGVFLQAPLFLLSSFPPFSPLPPVHRLGTNSHSWLVQSSDGQDKYPVNQLSSKCNNADCMLRCNECNICCHMYQCQCPDSLINCGLCKHIHLVHRFLTTEADEPPPDVDVDPVNDVMIDLQRDKYVDSELQSAMSSVRSRKYSENFSYVKDQAKAKLQQMLNAIEECETTDIEAVQYLTKQLTSINRTFNSLKDNNVPPSIGVKHHEPSNKNIEVQRFFSTKKKRKRPQESKVCKT